MNPLRVAVVDDEPLARALMCRHLEALEGVEVVAICANGFEAVKAVHTQEPDVLFLDIQMPQLDGFDVAELIGDRVAIIFVTAFDEYAVRAFEIHAVDYLLKPIVPDRLSQALERARERLPATPHKVLNDLSSEIQSRGVLTRIIVTERERAIVIPIGEIEWLEAQDDYVAVHTNGKVYLKHATLATMLEKLDPEQFVRIHRSHVVATDAIVEIERITRDRSLCRLRSGQSVPVSKAGVKRLQEVVG